MRFNRNVVGGLALAGLAVLIVAPSLFSKVLPLLFLAACPLSMIFMMKAMSGGRSQDTTATPSAGAHQNEASAEDEVVRLQGQLDQLKAEREHREAERTDPGRSDLTIGPDRRGATDA